MRALCFLKYLKMCYFSLKIPHGSILSSCYCTWCFCACSCGFPPGSPGSSYLTDGLALINCLLVWTSVWMCSLPCFRYWTGILVYSCLISIVPRIGSTLVLTRRKCWSKITNVMVMYRIVLHGWLNHPDRYFWYLYNLPTISGYLGDKKKTCFSL